jgi:DNA-binding transcriptional regulator YhcF (GntR family)
MANFKIEHSSDESKYQQLANHIIQQIKKGKLKLGQRLPSVNKLSTELAISRETVFKALNYLSERGIVYSKKRKGYFVNKTDVNTKLRICLILDRFTIFKDELYRSLFESIGENGHVDIFFHHHNYEFFKSLVKENLANYTHFAVVTFFKKDVKPILNLIPPEKRVILDCKEFGLKGEYTMVYQDFSKDIYNSLSTAQERLKKYERLKLVASNSLYHTDQVKEGFYKYCDVHHYDCELIDKVTSANFKKGTVYITISADEKDITKIIKLSHKHDYKIGSDVGVISYNDTPIKEILEGGITVISTDFAYMGQKAASLIMNNNPQIIANPSKITLRNSL